ncbi:hypothetical protein B0J12DRAFT_657458 [Macrophomina phaseolina]|uniref:Secreted protein n=1 Tax=Macrophomina phaseolina TaxID=35725 RepID=A0ABQ8GFX9_9PEZI|nr:hypothetical protein B0J12DRAFT_657458 [Macrophomina phaseolina]
MLPASLYMRALAVARPLEAAANVSAATHTSRPPDVPVNDVVLARSVGLLQPDSPPHDSPLLPATCHALPSSSAAAYINLSNPPPVRRFLSFSLSSPPTSTRG